jgi:transcriptional regulator with XRE-family HTH domain
MEVKPMADSTRKRTAKSLASVIRKHREAANLSVRQLAAISGTHHSLLARIENGDVLSPSAELLYRLANTLEIDANELLVFIGVKPSLPAPQVYFRKEFGVSDAEAREIVQLIEERYIKKRKQP